MFDDKQIHGIGKCENTNCTKPSCIGLGTKMFCFECFMKWHKKSNERKMASIMEDMN